MCALGTGVQTCALPICSGTSGSLGGSTGGSSSLAPVKIMAMGDSNTYGVHGYSNKEAGGYRLHLDHKLQAEGLSFDMVGTLRNGPSGFDRDPEGSHGIQSDGLKANKIGRAACRESGDQ